MDRLFCPTCGNAALERVEMVVGANGAEQYGIRRRHNLRGTKYSLPKPKVSFEIRSVLQQTATPNLCCQKRHSHQPVAD